MNAVIQSLAGVPRLNFWLGPGCSAGVTFLSEAEILRELRRQRADLPRGVGREDAFLLLNPEQRGKFIHLSFNGINWTYPCIAALAAQDRAGAIVLRNIDGLLPRLLTLRHLLPPLLGELADSSESADDSALTLFELPAIHEPERWKDPITKAGAGNPWIVAGVSKPRPTEIELLKEIATSGTPVYWVPLWDEPIPVDPSVQVVPGFDSDSFFAALTQATVGFPPGGLSATPGDPAKPDQLLQRALHAERETMQRSIENQMRAAGSSLEGLSDLDDAAFHARLDEFRRTRQRLTRLVPSYPNTGGIELLHSAKTTGGRRADALLALAADQHHKMPSRPENFTASLAAAHWVSILHARAKLRRPAAAEPFYENAYRTIQSLPPQEPRQWQVALDIAKMLDDWAATKEIGDAERLVRDAIDVLGRPRAAGRLQPYEEASLWRMESTLLRRHALRLDAEPSHRFFDEARIRVERLRAMDDAFMGDYMLGMMAFEKARTNRESQAELVASGNRHFAAALKLKKGSTALVSLDWGTVLATLARERDGADADDLFAQAFRHYASAAEDATASATVHNNWSGFLLVQARRKSGAARDALLTQSWTHAIKAEELEPTKGVYNLACIAAERGNWDEMSKWLRISARGPRFPAPAHTDSVTSFDPIRTEGWFQNLLAELYP